MSEAFFLTREALVRAFGERDARRFEALQQTVSETGVASAANVAATDALLDATLIVLSPNAELRGERVLVLGAGLAFDLTEDGKVGIVLGTETVRARGGYLVSLVAAGDSEVVVPLAGILATRENVEVLKNKTLDAPKLGGLGNYANDAAAAAGGVEVGGTYRNGSVVMVRVA